MNFKDLTGQKLGRSMVVGKSESKIDKSGRRRTVWRCICECGNEFEALADSLKRNPDLVCPICTNKNRSKNNRIDVVGNKYGRLTILDVIPNTRPTKVICRCDCGNEHICLQADVVSGHTQSCGCLQLENTSVSNTKDWSAHVAESGVQFIKQHHMNNSGQWIWECKCPICGNLFYELPAKINNGHTTSCGCKVQSFGEHYIHTLLEEMGVEFEPQYTFHECKSVYVLRFDFAIFDKAKLIGLIEYDGRQHFEPVDIFGGDIGFLNTQKRDDIKNTYCKMHNLPILRLPYTLSLSEIKQQICEYYVSLTTAGHLW